MPLRPNASKRATPPITGGSTSGIVTTARRTPIPGTRTRASTHASGTPKITDAAVASREDSRDSRRAVQTCSSR